MDGSKPSPGMTRGLPPLAVMSTNATEKCRIITQKKRPPAMITALPCQLISAKISVNVFPEIRITPRLAGPCPEWPC